MALDATILYLNNYTGTGLGGGEVHMRALVLAARDAGIRVVVACEPDTDVATEFLALGVPVEPIRFRGLAPLVAARHVRSLAQQIDADIIHSNGWFTNVVARLARIKGGPRIVNSVLVDPDAPRLSGATRAEQIARNLTDRQTFSSADAIVPITEAVASKLRALKAPANRIRVITGSVDADGVRESAGVAWRGFEVEPGVRYVGTVGRLESVKGADVFVRSAAVLAERYADVRFVVGGAGALAGDLHATATALRVSDRVVFAGKVPSAAATFAALDVVVVPSLSEGFGIVAAEAMALGKPVVASRVGGLPEVVEDGVTGLLVEPGDPSALAAAIGALLDDPERARKMGEAGRARVERDFTLERMTSAYLALYAELVVR